MRDVQYYPRRYSSGRNKITTEAQLSKTYQGKAHETRPNLPTCDPPAHCLVSLGVGGDVDPHRGTHRRRPTCDHDHRKQSKKKTYLNVSWQCPWHAATLPRHETATRGSTHDMSRYARTCHGMSWQPTTVSIAHHGMTARASPTSSAPEPPTGHHGKRLGPRHTTAMSTPWRPTAHHGKIHGKAHGNLHGSLQT